MKPSVTRQRGLLLPGIFMTFWPPVSRNYL
jgi:hypothetical protein